MSVNILDVRRPSATRVIEQNTKGLTWTPNPMHVQVLDVERSTLIQVHFASTANIIKKITREQEEEG